MSQKTEHPAGSGASLPLRRFRCAVRLLRYPLSFDAAAPKRRKNCFSNESTVAKTRQQKQLFRLQCCPLVRLRRRYKRNRSSGLSAYPVC